MKQAFRLAVVNSHPIQYFAPLYAYLNRDPGLEVTALYCSDFSLRGATDPGFRRAKVWDVDHSERLAREVLSLPMYAELRPEQIEHFVASVRSFNV